MPRRLLQWIRTRILGLQPPKWLYADGDLVLSPDNNYYLFREGRENKYTVEVLDGYWEVFWTGAVWLKGTPGEHWRVIRHAN